MFDGDAAATGAGVVSEDLDSLDGRVGSTEDVDAATVGVEEPTLGQLGVRRRPRLDVAGIFGERNEVVGAGDLEAA